MRNLGLALMLVGTILVPHAAGARKHEHKKAGRTAPKRSAVHAQRAQQPSELETAVAEKRAQAEPQPTAAAPPQAHEPVNMSTQDLDDEVPGARKKK